MFLNYFFVFVIINVVFSDRPPPRCPQNPTNSKPHPSGLPGSSSSGVATAYSESSASSSRSSSSSYASSSSHAVASNCNDYGRCTERNATYKRCPNPCPGTCSNPEGVKHCFKMCLTFGCECYRDHVLSDNGKCVLLKDCPDYLRCHGDRNATYTECPNPCPKTCQFPGESEPCSKRCKKDGCQCKEGYYLDERGKCVHFEDCPGAKACSSNETFVFCNAGCPTDYCPQDDSRAMIACSPPFPCKSGCACKGDYLKLSDDRCILATECPPVTCTRQNEIWDSCPPPCLNDRCSDIGKPNLCDKRYHSCRPQCVCRPGFYRNDNDICVPKKQCDALSCYGDRNATYKECPNPCPRTCQFPGRSRPCNKMCKKEGCECNEGYYLGEDGKCVQLQDCPGAKYCSSNETFVFCKAGCPTNYCPKDDNRAVIACSPPFPCGSGCSCNGGYLRLSDDKCILASECPPVTCTRKNEIWDSCPPPCLKERCSDIGQPNQCVNDKRTYFCRPQCVCRSGFYRNDNDICVPEKQCYALSCHGDRNATYKECPNPCPRTCQYPGGPGPCNKLCKKEGCECNEGYYLGEDGKCVELQDCPGAKYCSSNETFVFCKAGCPTNYCPKDDNRAIIACSLPFPCGSGCSCNGGYLRLSDDKCILASECPPVTCTRKNEIWDSCPPPCLKERCSDIGQPNQCVNDKLTHFCRPQCVCRPGFYRNDNDICVPEKQCYPLGCHGDRNATFKECPNPCPSTCQYPGRPGPCNKMCKKEGCQCNEGYYLGEDGKCVELQDCPGAKACSSNETFAYCNVGCPNNYCPEDDRRAIIACSPPNPCKSGCSCKGGFLRLRSEKNRCILASQCPPVTCTRPNEIWGGCPPPCYKERCSDIGQPNQCDKRFYSCRPQCICRPGFYRNDTGFCVPEKQCPPRCGYNEMAVQCRTICPPQVCENSYTDYACGEPTCEPGCDCIQNHLRNSSGICIPNDQCPPPPTAPTCGPNEEPSSCRIICPPQSCASIYTLYNCIADIPCEDGCNCIKGYLRNSSGVCVPSETCPTKPPIICGPNEVSTECRIKCPPQSCESTYTSYLCGNDTACEPGCDCIDQYLRNASGVCIPSEECTREPTCGPNEELSSCKIVCPPQSCESTYTLYLCSAESTCEYGCNCISGYLRDANGDCVPSEKCPPNPLLRCGPNEVSTNCKIVCPAQTCESLYTKFACPNNTICEPGCDCIDSYRRNASGVCIPTKECFTETQCVLPEECRPTCANPNPQNCPPVSPTTDNQDGCICKPGYILSETRGPCIKIEECPFDKGCNGDPNSIVASCPWPCPSTCKSPNAGTCGKKCDAIGCQCKPGFILSKENGKCILPDNCSYGNPCGVNGTFSECGFRCPNQNCPEDDSQFVIACKPGRPCPSGCLCKDYYKRKNEDDTCVLASDCTPVECTRPNEIWDPCASECLAERCSDINQKSDCYADPQNCQPKCVCIKDHYRNESDYCVPKKDCKRRCSINPECRPTCAVPNPPGCPFIQPSDSNDDDCNCQKGYVLSEVGGKCIKIEDCPADISCNGDPHARVKESPVPCPSTCDAPNAKPCKRMSDPIGCECQPGYILSNINGKCILPDNCKGGNPCGPNGTFACQYNCPTSYCPVDDSRGSVICETYPFAPCFTGCVCRLNHKFLSRDEPRCIQSDECPPVKCTRPNEKWNRCPMECSSGYCEEVDQPYVACNSLVLNCNPQCMCKKGFLRNPETDICVSFAECRRINANNQSLKPV